jgi:hypothetical protein
MICADEFAMADEAFALSPISARAARPSEEDYEAISQAFMETSRGRWFLGEYARRNRNADTRMVLDAVARIEENLAAQRSRPVENRLPEALVAIRSALEEARSAARASLDPLAPEQSLAPIRSGAQVMREISWRLRESGDDGRICDLIDSQVGAIEGAFDQIASADPLSALNSVFDLIERRIAEFDDTDAAAPETVDEAIPAAIPTQPNEMAGAAEVTIDAATEIADAMETVEATTDPSPVELAGVEPEALETVEIPRAVETTQEAKAEETLAETMAVAPEVAEVGAEADDAYDDAMLDLVALEMAAPDASDVDDAFEDHANQTNGAQLAVADLEVIPPRAEARNPEPPPPEPMTAPSPAIQMRAQPLVQPALETSFAPSPDPLPVPEPSLGSSLIASGIVRRPKTSMADPLAPIRRMSQTEKIAFFS